MSDETPDVTTLRLTIDIPVKIRSYATPEEILYHRADGTYCLDAVVEELAALRDQLKKQGGCLCDVPHSWETRS